MGSLSSVHRAHVPYIRRGGGQIEFVSIVYPTLVRWSVDLNDVVDLDAFDLGVFVVTRLFVVV